jgi:hypothetical protein
MNRLEEFLQNLDIKNKIMLYVSLVIVAGIIYYNFNLGYMSSKIEDNKKVIKDLEKKIHFSIKENRHKLAVLKKEYKQLILKERKHKENLEYLNRRISFSSLRLDDSKFYSLLRDILNKSNLLNLAPNFVINKKVDKFVKYNLEINGSLNICEEKKFFELIKFLESTKYVSNIESLDRNSTDYLIHYTVWGIK